MGLDPGNVHVLVPGEWGELDVCPLDLLIEHLFSGDYDTLDKVLEDSSIQGLDIRTIEDYRNHVKRVRDLNETGDANAFWGHT